MVSYSFRALLWPYSPVREDSALSHLRSAFLLPLVVAIAACSGGGGGGSDDTDDTGTPGVEEPGTAPSLTLAITSEPELTATEDLRWTYQVETELSDNLTFTLVQAPAGMTIDEDGLIVWVPDGTITSADVVLAVGYVNGTDIRGNTQSFTLTVNPVNDKPEFITLADDLPLTAVAGTVFSYQFDVSDPDDANNGTDLTFAVELPYVSSTPEEYGVAISPTGLLTWQVPASPNLLLRWTGLRIRVTVTDGQEDWKTNLVAVPSLAWNLKVV
ncbi:MAG: hypothetical protein CSH36_07510, partial [Thalassolituus sp.]